jgi:large subunit ribosomal protein L17
MIRHGKVKTTEAKAKELRSWLEPLVTLAKEDSVHRRQLAFSKLRDKDLVHLLFSELGPRYKERPGGYTRRYKLEPRTGDRAKMALIEFVG